MRFNKWLGTKLANAVGTMTFFYFCLILDIIMLPPVIKQRSITLWVTYLAQTVIQLLALPLLAYQARISQDNHKDTLDHIKHIKKHLGIKDNYDTSKRYK
ncbi:MAG: hypothetical protein KGI25_03585 [Thaumarchaeota archaeon]|nr:hypothetical protein [Nitrososphaerota archaeon]